MSQEPDDSMCCAIAFWTVVVLSSLLGYVLAWLCWEVLLWKANSARAKEERRRTRRRLARSARKIVQPDHNKRHHVRRKVASISADEPDATQTQEWSVSRLSVLSHFPPPGLTPSQARMLRQRLGTSSEPSMSRPCRSAARPRDPNPRSSAEPEGLETFLRHWRSDPSPIPFLHDIGPLEVDRRGASRPV